MSTLSRRKFLSYSLGAAAAGVAPASLLQSAHAAAPIPTPESLNANTYQQAIEAAIQFQNQMMDAYATGKTVRLVQSYADQSGLESTAFTYDNAVSIHAYLLHGSADSQARAEILGQGLIYAQANNFPFNDGRFAQAYFVNAPSSDGVYVTPAAFPFFFYTSAVGDQAWAGMALAQLFKRTGDGTYLTSALNAGNWIVNNTYSTLAPGGFSFGTNINQFNQSVPSGNGKSTEHNIDTYALFTMLDALTNHGSAANGMTWSALAAHALGFVIAMWNPAGPFFWTGTAGATSSAINYYPIPEDCQTWSYLAMLNGQYVGSIDWALKNLQPTDTASSPHSSLTGTESFTGMTFDTASLNTTFADPNAVWLEGTAHTIAALIVRTGAEVGPARVMDWQAALKLVNTCDTGQAELGANQTVNGIPIPMGRGLVAATSLLDTGFGYTYGTSKHIGATGWYLIATQGGNPFQLGYSS
jgi:hypothetical protein